MNQRGQGQACRGGQRRRIGCEQLESRRLLTVTNVDTEVVDNSAADLPGSFVTNDIEIDFTGQYLGSQLLIELTSGSIFEDTVLGTTIPPTAGAVSLLPAVEFDSFVAQGSDTSPSSFGDPNVGGAAVDVFNELGRPIDLTAEFGESGVNQAWNPAGGADVFDQSDFLVARITLSADAAGEFHYLGSTDSGLFLTSGSISGGTFGGVATAPEIDLRGGGQSIPDGDSDPRLADDTDFDEVVTSSGSKTNTFTIANTGTATLEISDIEISGSHAADFSLGPEPTSIAAGATATFDVTFDPSADGLRTATLIVTSNDADEATYDFAIEGTGIPDPAPEIDVRGLGQGISDGDATPSLSDGTDFGDVISTAGTNTNTFSIANTGNATLTISMIEITGTSAGDFVLGTTPASVPAGGTADFDVTFDPSANGLRTATVIVTSNDADEATYDFAIEGNGIPQPAPEIDVRGLGQGISDGDTTPSLADDTDFGDVDTASGTETHTFTIANTGDASLSISEITVTGAHAGDFGLGATPGSVAAGGTATFGVTFDPAADGVRTATVTINSNDADEGVYDFVIQGTGTTAVPEVPEIAVFGAGTEILDGDTTPSRR